MFEEPNAAVSCVCEGGTLHIPVHSRSHMPCVCEGGTLHVPVCLRSQMQLCLVFAKVALCTYLCSGGDSETTT